MPSQDIVRLLVEERDRINRAIDALRDVPTQVNRRGRTWTAAQRKAQGERIRKAWAARRKVAKSA